jgi:hypothetical protein
MVRIHREPPSLERVLREGSGVPTTRRFCALWGRVPYKHFGARLARLDRFDSCTLHHILCAGSSTDQNSWPTTNRCGFNSRTAHQLTPPRQNRACRGPGAGLARRSSPRSIIAKCWFDSNILHRFIRGLAVNRSALANCSRDPALALAHRGLSWVTGRDG